MPIFARVRKFTICVYGAPREHNPPHFHVNVGSQCVGRFEIKSFEELTSHSLNAKDLALVKRFWEQNKEDLLVYFCLLNPNLCASR